MTATSAKLVAAALGLLLAGGAVADASAATVVTKTRTVAATHAVKHVATGKTVKIVHRFHRLHRPHLAAVRVLPGHRLAPRFRMAHAVVTKHVVKKTVIR